MECNNRLKIREGVLKVCHIFLHTPSTHIVSALSVRLSMNLRSSVNPEVFLELVGSLGFSATLYEVSGPYGIGFGVW